MYDGNLLLNGIKQTNIAGCDVTDYLREKLNKKEIGFKNTADREIVRDIKEKLCYVNSSLDGSLIDENINKSASYELPDGQIIEINQERYEVCEIMFNPKIIERNEKGIHEMIYESISTIQDSKIRNEILENIYVIGGNSMFNGIGERLKLELKRLFKDDNININIKLLPERKYSTWFGISVLSSLSNFQKHWFSKEEYDEHGPNYIWTTCQA